MMTKTNDHSSLLQITLGYGTTKMYNDDFALHRQQKLCFMPYDLRPMTNDL